MVVPLMVLHVFTKHHYVIKVINNLFVKERSEQIIYQSAKGGWSITQPKNHKQKIIAAIPHHAGYLWLIAFYDLNLVTPLP